MLCVHNARGCQATCLICTIGNGNGCTNIDPRVEPQLFSLALHASLKICDHIHKGSSGRVGSGRVG